MASTMSNLYFLTTLFIDTQFIFNGQTIDTTKYNKKQGYTNLPKVLSYSMEPCIV